MATEPVGRAAQHRGVGDVDEIAPALYPAPNGGASFECPRCGAVSHHPCDVAQGYCGRCHGWTGHHG